MSEHSNQPNTTPETAQDAQETPESNGHARKRQRSVIFYISILFVAAFLLLSMSLVQERRQHSENLENLEDLNQSITGLKDSVSAMQSVQHLYEQNAALNEQLDELQKQLEDAKNEAAQQEKTIAELSATLERTEKAMDYFWQIDEAFVRNRWYNARQLIAVMEDTTNGYALKDYLPAESTTNNGRFSPAGRYAEIFDRVN